MNQDIANRIAVLIRLIKRSPSRSLGRTQIMKLAYFLNVVKRVPLNYRFSLYSYGPFDQAVLQDVDLASNLGALTSTPIQYPTGFGYLIQASESSGVIESLGREFVEKYSKQIDWVIDEFATWTASDLELASTIVYIDLETRVTSPVDLAKRVHDVKPHFPVERIASRIQDLKKMVTMTVH